MDVQKLISYLRDFMTNERAEKMDLVVKNRTRHISILLENIYQSQNASAVLRTADCFGVQDIHVVENENEFDVHPDIALGSSKWLTIHRYNQTANNTVAAINELKSKGYRILATMPHENECMLDDLDLSIPTVFMFGTELTGLSDEAIAHADGFVKIPMYGFTESFNISVSAALVLQNAVSKIRNSNVNWQLPREEEDEIILEWYKRTVKNSDMIVERFLESAQEK